MIVPPEVVAAQRRASDPDANVWVSASAGSGKTKVLADRALRLLLGGTAPERILCLTFTRAAAAEMANRISDELGRWAASGDDGLAADLAKLTGTAPEAAAVARARRLFAAVLDAPGGMKIMTIHAFCESVLRRFPLEAGVSPHFEVMDERTSFEALHAAREEVFERAQAGEAALAAALGRVSAWLNEYGLGELVGEFVAKRPHLARLLRDRRFAEDAEAVFAECLGVPRGATESAILAAFADLPQAAEQRLRLAAEALLAGSPTDAKKGRAIADWLADRATRADRFETYAEAFVTFDSPLWRAHSRLITKGAADACPPAVEILNDEAARVLATIERRNAVIVHQTTVAAVTLARELLAVYDARKARAAQLDYDDLIAAARGLVERQGAAAWVLFKLDGGIDHILIDEAQDTNPDQWGVVRALADEFTAGAGARERARTLFAVGDAKQSIFGFQRASPAEFREMGRRSEARTRAAGARWDAVGLDASFRSAEAILRAVDATFAVPHANDGLGEGKIRHVLTRDGEGGMVEVWPLAPAEQAETTDPWRPAGVRGYVDRAEIKLAHGIATTVAGWLASGERLESRGDAVRAGDIMVLVRHRTEFVDSLVSALKLHGVSVAGVDRMILTDQVAIMDLMALGSFLLLPDDDLRLAEVLKGPLVGLDEDDLFALAHGRPSTLWSALRRRGEEPRFAPAADYLRHLLARVDYAGPFELYSEILGPLSGRERILARLGEEANDPLDEFLSLALEYERMHPPSLQGFIQWLSEGAVEIKRDLEWGVRDEVRVMTVHGAKGLQAPIVFLADTTQPPIKSLRILWTEVGGLGTVPLWPPVRDRQEALSRAARAAADAERDREYQRLLYVAMTRARDRLYVCGHGTGQRLPERCWYETVRRGLAGIAEPVEIEVRATGSAGWRGPGLRLATPQVRSAPRQESPAVAPPDLPPWARRPAPAEPSPSRPLAPSRPREDEPAALSPLGADGGREFRRGVVIHRLLETLPGLPPEARAAAARRLLARPVLALAEGEQEEIAAEALAVLARPETAELFGPGSRAEVPIVGVVGDGAISGRIDRLVVGDGWIKIVDYKTNRPVPHDSAAIAPAYLRQLALYRAAIARIYPMFWIACGILWTAGPRLAWIEEGRLEGSAPVASV